MRKTNPTFKFILPKNPLGYVIAFCLGVSVSLYSEFIKDTTKPQCLNSEEVRLCFSPEGRCEEKIVNEIDKAQSEILVQTFSFTSRQIAQSLIEARQRGVNVKVLYDESSNKSVYSKIPLLKKHLIPSKVDSSKGLAHNKVMIIDQKTVITGSYNFSHAASTKNAENLLIINNATVAAIYKDNWNKRSQI